MADYYPIIARAVANLPQNTEVARRAIYERARTTLVSHLRGQSEEVIRERRLLDEAIRKVETEATAKQHTAALYPATFPSELPEVDPRHDTFVTKDNRIRGRRALLITGSLLGTAVLIAIGFFALAGSRWPAITQLPKSAAFDAATPAASAAQNSDEMVVMRIGVTCQLQGVSYLSTVGPDGNLTNNSGSVKKLLCAYSGAASKEIPLANGKMENGLIKTKDFGDIRVDFENSLYGNGFTVYMRSADQDKLVTFLKI